MYVHTYARTCVYTRAMRSTSIQRNEERTCGSFSSFFSSFQSARNAAFQVGRAVFSRRTSLSAPERRGRAGGWLPPRTRQLIFRDKFIDGRYSRPDAGSDVSKGADNSFAGRVVSPAPRPTQPACLLIFMNSIKTAVPATGRDSRRATLARILSKVCPEPLLLLLSLSFSTSFLETPSSFFLFLQRKVNSPP